MSETEEDLCVKGHNDWIPQRNGRRCRECKNSQQREARGGSRQSGTSWAVRTSDKGYIESTFTRTELLRARGYDL